jgi:hypothetical protein
MKKVNYLVIIGALILSTTIIFSGCKKKSSTPSYPTPAFIVTSTTVTLQDGTLGIEFFTVCSTTDVTMTKVEILSPIHDYDLTYNLGNVLYVKNQIFDLQAANTAYTKESGSYTFTFTGIRNADSSPFTIVSTLVVAGK